jgi:hypothetical protein
LTTENDVFYINGEKQVYNYLIHNPLGEIK